MDNKSMHGKKMIPMLTMTDGEPWMRSGRQRGCLKGEGRRVPWTVRGRGLSQWSSVQSRDVIKGVYQRLCKWKKRGGHRAEMFWRSDDEFNQGQTKGYSLELTPIYMDFFSTPATVFWVFFSFARLRGRYWGWPQTCPDLAIDSWPCIKVLPNCLVSWWDWVMVKL